MPASKVEMSKVRMNASINTSLVRFVGHKHDHGSKSLDIGKGFQVAKDGRPVLDESHAQHVENFAQMLAFQGISKELWQGFGRQLLKWKRDSSQSSEVMGLDRAFGRLESTGINNIQGMNVILHSCLP